MRFYWYWYQHLLLGFGTLAILYYIKWHILDGDDILLSLIKFCRRKR